MYKSSSFPLAQVAVRTDQGEFKVIPRL